MDPRRLQRLRARAGSIATIRRFLDTRGYLSVETPQLSPTPIPEAHIELFATRRRAQGRSQAPATQEGATSEAQAAPAALYLLPSPEYHLKRLLAEGSGNIYEITHSFRNGEIDGPQHRIEFTMLEYYTVDADAEVSLALTRELLEELGLGSHASVIAMSEAWEGLAGIRLQGAAAGGERDALIEAIHAAGLSPGISPGETWEDIFQRIFLSYVEPELPRDRPVFLTHYPAAIPTLARPLPGTPWADRWELYLGGMEVANCFGEETDPRRIYDFLAGQDRSRPAAGTTRHSWDAAFLQDPPLPRCSGVALGVDRLVMAITGAASIEEVLSMRAGH